MGKPVSASKKSELRETRYFISQLRQDSWEENFQTEQNQRDFPGVPVVKTLCFHFTGWGFHLWLGNLRSCMPHGVARKKKGEGGDNRIGRLLMKHSFTEGS